MHALIDGDILAYRCAAATEYQTYHHKAFGTFRYKKDMDNYVFWNTESDKALEKEYDKVLVTEPISSTYHAVDSSLNKILRAVDAQSYTLYIAGKGKTFRHKVDYPVLYKDGRAEKPSNFEQARDYILKLQNVVEVFEIETDDALGIAQCGAPKGTTVIATIDKDLKGIPGYYYHIVDETLTNITELEAERQFWSQMLQGDSTDNILGIKGIGPKTSDKMLASCASKAEMMEVVHAAYEKNWPTQYREMWRANKKLLWILRKPLEETYGS